MRAMFAPLDDFISAFLQQIHSINSALTHGLATKFSDYHDAEASPPRGLRTETFCFARLLVVA